MDKTRAKAYSYVRMSTEIQLRGDSLRRQREWSQRYATDHDLEIDQEFDLHDIGLSGFTGANLESGNFGRFLNAVRQGKIARGSYLLVESFDRLSRQEPVKALRPFLELVEAGINLVTLDDERVFSGQISFEDLIISIVKMSRANEESVRKSDRLSQAWSSKRKFAATRKLTARCPSWLRLSDDKTSFSVIEERAAIVRRIFTDAVNGLGAYSIVRHLNQDAVPTFVGKSGWQTSTVNSLLTTKAVIGEFQPQRMVRNKRFPEGEPIKDYFPRIVSDEIFNAAQRARLTRKTTPSEGQKGSGGRKGATYSNLFAKLAVCAHCKSPMNYVDRGGMKSGYPHLVCSNARRGFGCTAKAGWRYDQFETAFLSLVEKLDLASLISSEQHEGRRAELVNKLQAAEGKQKRLERELDLAFETNVKLGGTSEFLAKKIASYEKDITQTKEIAKDLRVAIAQMEATSLVYYKDKTQIIDLIDQVRSSKGAGVFKVRSQIASRLQSIIANLELLIERDQGGQEFEVNFKDGAHLKVFVDPKNPTQILQVVREKDGVFIVTDADGRDVDRYTMDEPSEVGGY